MGVGVDWFLSGPQPFLRCLRIFEWVPGLFGGFHAVFERALNMRVLVGSEATLRSFVAPCEN